MIAPERIRTRVLSCGLTALCVRMDDAPVAAVQVWYRAGSASERDGIRGISHMLEHMMFRGSANVASEEHTRRIAAVGGHCNAFTSEDVTAYLNAVPAAHLDLVLELEADRMHRITLSPELFETERKVIVEEFHQYVNNPVARSFLEYREVFFANTPYSTSPLGRLDDIAAITTADLTDYWRTHYSADNTVVAVVGDVPDEDRVFDRIEELFCKGRRAAPALHLTDSDVRTRVAGGVMHRRIAFDVPIVLSGYPAPSASHPDALALDIAGMVLTHGETSRLHRELVRRTQMAVMAGGMNHCLRHAGMSLFFAIHTPDTSGRKVAAALAAEVERLAGDSVIAAEIEKIRVTALTHRTFETCTAESVCQHLAHAQAVEGDWHHWLERLERLSKLSPDDVSAAVARWWKPEDRLVMHLKPERLKLAVYMAGMLRRILPRGN